MGDLRSLVLGEEKVLIARWRWAMKRIVVVAALFVAGCTQSVSEMSYSQLQAYSARMVEKCQKQGVPQSQMQARSEQEIHADQSRRMKQRQFGAAISGASQAYGQGMQSAARPVTCTSTPSSTWVGAPASSVRTTCY